MSLLKLDDIAKNTASGLDIIELFSIDQSNNLKE